jgi:hypothetical protein
MSGHGKRERVQRADAALWRDRIVADAQSDAVRAFLEARGHIERVAGGDLIRPIGARAGELF